jgi:hypothetical protein
MDLNVVMFNIFLKTVIHTTLNFRLGCSETAHKQRCIRGWLKSELQSIVKCFGLVCRP